MLNTALAKAIIDSGKKKKTIARLARMSPGMFSKILHCTRPASETQRDRLARVLGKPVEELFPSHDESAVA